MLARSRLPSSFVRDCSSIRNFQSAFISHTHTHNRHRIRSRIEIETRAFIKRPPRIFNGSNSNFKFDPKFNSDSITSSAQLTKPRKFLRLFHEHDPVRFSPFPLFFLSFPLRSYYSKYQLLYSHEKEVTRNDRVPRGFFKRSFRLSSSSTRALRTEPAGGGKQGRELMQLNWTKCNVARDFA